MHIIEAPPSRPTLHLDPAVLPELSALDRIRLRVSVALITTIAHHGDRDRARARHREAVEREARESAARRLALQILPPR